jgi:DNA polymerase-1
VTERILAAVGRGDPLALVVSPSGGPTVVSPAGAADVALDDVRRIEADLAPRWVWWSASSVSDVLRVVSIARGWDLAAAHRLVHGGWRADPAIVWARSHELDPDTVPVPREPDLFHQGLAPEELDEPLDAEGHLRPEWIRGAWSATPARRARWGALALEVASRQRDAIAALSARHPQATATARAESTAAILCVELGATGLPVDVSVAEQILLGIVGPRPRTTGEAEAQRAARDADVLRHAPSGTRADLRNPAHVRSLLRRVGVEVTDTRAWRLEQLRDTHPLVAALLVWRRVERTATTYGYAWLDEHVRDGRLRGEWTASDGAAGRMTATAGLHNLPAEIRPAVVAEPGHGFVRADLGQIEPRVLAAVSGDRALARAAATADMYAPVAAELGVDRDTAKRAVLGAMYGQTTGHGAQALRRLEATYPVAMAYLQEADEAGQVGRSIRTYGGRLISFSSPNANEVTERDARSRAAANGRYGRNAMIQGAAAELFKRWAVTVRARLAGRGLGGEIVLCLHDELLVHTPVDAAAEVARLVDDCLQEAAAGWAPDDRVRFVAETSIVPRWSDAK